MHSLAITWDCILLLLDLVITHPAPDPAILMSPDAAWTQEQGKQSRFFDCHPVTACLPTSIVRLPENSTLGFFQISFSRALLTPLEMPLGLILGKHDNIISRLKALVAGKGSIFQNPSGPCAFMQCTEYSKKEDFAGLD